MYTESFPQGTYQCVKANYEIILCPSGKSTKGRRKPSKGKHKPSNRSPKENITQPLTNGLCGGQGFDSAAFWCDADRLCRKDEKACGSNPHSCYRETMHQCVHGKVRPK